MSETIKFNNLSKTYTTNIGFEIRNENELYDNEKELLEKSNLHRYAPIETWTALGTNSQLAYSTHGIFRYFGKFPPVIATYLISQYTTEKDLIIDPMSGSGTTAVECDILKRECIVNDLNPMSYLLAKVKTTQIGKDILLNKLNELKENYKPLTTEEYNFIPLALRDPDHWFLTETSNSLRGIKYLIEQEHDEDLRNFLNIVFASIVRKVSKATTQQGRLFLDVETAEPDAWNTFEKKYLKSAEAVASLPVRNKISYFNEDLKNLNKLNPKEKAALVILHPPYFNSYKYSSINMLETGWLGYERNKYNKAEIREAFKVGKPEKVTEYIADMKIALENALSLLKSNGVLALMIGDTILKGNYIPVTDMLLQATDLSGYEIEKIAIRVPKYTEAMWVASQRRHTDTVGITLYDYIVVIRKN